MKLYWTFIWMLVSVMAICCILIGVVGFEKPKCTHIFVAVESEEAIANSLSASLRTIVCIKCYNMVSQKVKPSSSNSNHMDFINMLDSFHTNSH